MVWMTFAKDFDFKPSSQVTVAHKKGDRANVTREAAVAAEKIGAGKRDPDTDQKAGKVDGTE